MTDFLSAEPYYIALLLAVFGGLYIWAERAYLRVLTSQTGQEFPAVGAGLSSFLSRPWMIPAGVMRLSQSLRKRQVDGTVEAARLKFLARRRWI